MIYIPIALKLYAFGLTMLQDPNWTGMNMCDYVKQHVRGRIEPVELLRKPLEVGLPYFLGTWLFDEYFDESRIEELDGEYQAWHLEDLLGLLAYHDADVKRTISYSGAAELLNRVNAAYEVDEKQYFDLLDELADSGKLVAMYARLGREFSNNLSAVKSEYCANYADRVFHDRQLCAFISQVLLTIGFDGTGHEDEDPKQWVQRIAWPERVKAMLRARDRGACASCGANIVMELDEEAHIDHIVPLSRGGTNDIVNLQLLCAPCNQKKYASRVDVDSSIPAYLRRNRAT